MTMLRRDLPARPLAEGTPYVEELGCGIEILQRQLTPKDLASAVALRAR